MVVERIRQFRIDAQGTARRESRVDPVVVEEPLEIRVEGEPLAVVMRTPGHDVELAAGLLVAEEILRDADEIGVISHCRDTDGLEAANVVNVRLSPEASSRSATMERLRERTRPLLSSSSCGLCGKQRIEALHHGAPPFPTGLPAPARALIHSLPDRLRERQDIFQETGGLHGAAVFAPSGELLVVREDVGRHNAVDKCVGALFLGERLPLADALLVVSGRVSFEIVQKALVARLRTVVAVSAPSSLGVELARESNMTLCGFVRPGSLNVYAGQVL